LTNVRIIGQVKMIKCNVRGASIPDDIKLINPINKDKMHRGKRK